ncbi:MAG: hypothetical protein IKZ43_02475 [Acidaminococcaceae bacterium]|nr:hypothetical protein [Acidaminococcaceae bacterium]
MGSRLWGNRCKRKNKAVMSGGIISAVTDYRLKVAGFSFTGVALRTWSGTDGA